MYIIARDAQSTISPEIVNSLTKIVLNQSNGVLVDAHGAILIH